MLRHIPTSAETCFCRDLLGSILCTVKEYASQVNEAMAVIRDNMQHTATTSEEQLTEHLQDSKQLTTHGNAFIVGSIFTVVCFLLIFQEYK